MKCPACDETLVMADRSGVKIDYCPKCRGVWLDRGELDKIIERSAAETAPQPAPQPMSQRQDYDRGHDRGYDQRGHYGKHRKRKSWLEEIFD
jgi:Zn-finger nucleic acid-binding protein